MNIKLPVLYSTNTFIMHHVFFTSNQMSIDESIINGDKSE